MSSGHVRRLQEGRAARALDRRSSGWEAVSAVPGSVAPFRIYGPITRDDLPGLCARVCAVLSVAGPDLGCDVSTVPADAVTVEALALLQLAARRRGCRIRLRGASADLVGLVAFLGLADVLPEEPVSPPAAPAD